MSTQTNFNSFHMHHFLKLKTSINRPYFGKNATGVLVHILCPLSVFLN